MILYTIIVLLLLIAGAFAYLSYVTYIKYKKVLEYSEVYVMFVSSLWYKFNDTKAKMDEIDRRGSFRADDEVGHTFTALQDCINELYDFITKYVNKEESTEIKK